MPKQMVILGGGESGTGAALLARSKGYDVFVSDIGFIPKHNKIQLSAQGISFEEGRHTEDKVLQAQEIVKSPGIPDSVPLLQQARLQDIPVISEIELACRYTKAHLTGITGTNGKSTATMLTHHLMNRSGIDAALAGNIGKGFARSVAEGRHSHYVLELSSFQLDGMHRSRINTAVLLNITPDHLDRYKGDLALYIKSKFRIFRNMRRGDLCIYNGEDHNIAGNLDLIRTQAERRTFGLNRKKGCAAYANAHYLMFWEQGRWKRISRRLLNLPGDHNVLNAMASILAARGAGVEWEAIKAALPEFRGLPHRMELVTKIRDVAFYDDSKATNVDAVRFALESFDRPVIWLAGGVDKGNDYRKIVPVVREKVKALVAIGLDTKKLQEVFTPVLGEVSCTDSMFRAVEIAYARADRGDVVLLSPACASFDLFKNFEERGDKFREAALSLKEKEDNPVIHLS
jgi:UDP-N-acetylmuramoylalanine--D-glutamate ligase